MLYSSPSIARLDPAGTPATGSRPPADTRCFSPASINRERRASPHLGDIATPSTASQMTVSPVAGWQEGTPRRAPIGSIGTPSVVAKPGDRAQACAQRRLTKLRRTGRFILLV